MSWWFPHKFEEKRPFLRKRRMILRELRNFFDERDFIEVDTPALQICPTIDTHVHGFKTKFFRQDLAPIGNYYLHTSPEFDMKKLLVAGMSRIYQICHVYRNAEGSRLHSPEFTMIEWYRTGENYKALMEDCILLLREIAKNLDLQTYKHRGRECDPFAPWEIISVAEAFEKYAGMDLSLYLDDREMFSNAIEVSGIRVADDDQWDDLFFRVMAEKIEPYLGAGHPTILYDYPVCMASLSRRKLDDPRYSERFELYVCGVELANAYSELIDPVEQRARCEIEMQAKQDIYGYRYPADEDFFEALEYGMPECTGIALGVDRLVMLASGADDISQVVWAPVQKLAEK